MYETTLSFQELEDWLRASVSRSLSIHIATARGIPAFVEGPIDTVMRFEPTDSHGLLIEGASGAWTFQLPEPDFVSATLRPMPDSFTTEQLQIGMRDHIIVIDPGTVSDTPLEGRDLHQ
jgi:hypothetical protein